MLSSDGEAITFEVEEPLGFAYDLKSPLESRLEEGYITEKEVVRTVKGNYILRIGHYLEGEDRKTIENVYHVCFDMEDLIEELDDTCPLERILLVKLGALESKSVEV